MIRRIVCGLAGGVLGAGAVTLLWWLLLGPCLLLAGLTPGGLVDFARTPKGAVLTFLLTPLGLVHGALVGAVRGRLGGAVVLEVLWSPFAWVLSAGDGLLGGLTLLLSLVPGACLGMLLGLLVGGPAGPGQRLPDAAVIGALVGMAASLLGYNLYLQWPGLRGQADRPGG
jgi:hypothetical protein